MQTAAGNIWLHFDVCVRREAAGSLLLVLGIRAPCCRQLLTVSKNVESGLSTACVGFVCVDLKTTGIIRGSGFILRCTFPSDSISVTEPHCSSKLATPLTASHQVTWTLLHLLPPTAHLATFETYKMCLPCFSFSNAQYERGDRQPTRQYQYVWNGQAWVLQEAVSSSDIIACTCSRQTL
jgi:hypothetical protein